MQTHSHYFHLKTYFFLWFLWLYIYYILKTQWCPAATKPFSGVAQLMRYHPQPLLEAYLHKRNWSQSISHFNTKLRFLSHRPMAHWGISCLDLRAIKLPFHFTGWKTHPGTFGKSQLPESSWMDGKYACQVQQGQTFSKKLPSQLALIGS